MQNVAIIGTTGSIGKAFLEYYVSNNTTDRVYSISRSKNNVEDEKIILKVHSDGGYITTTIYKLKT